MTGCDTNIGGNKYCNTRRNEGYNNRGCNRSCNKDNKDNPDNKDMCNHIALSFSEASSSQYLASLAVRHMVKNWSINREDKA